MNITVETLPECQVAMKVEVPAEKVASARSKIVSGYAKQVKLPGFRPGKVPKSVVEKRFGDGIKDELSKQLVNEGCQEGIKENSLDILSVDTITEDSFEDDGTFKFTASITTRPQFELPEYKKLAVEVPKVSITDEDVDKALEQARERFADFEEIEGKPVEMGNVAVLDYVGSVDGKPVGEAIPNANAYLAANKDHWMKMGDEVFLPGFCEGLIGANIGDEREVTVTLPEEFPIEDARGTEITYKVTVKGLKEMTLPEIDDDLAGKIQPGTNLEDLKKLIREDMEKQQTTQQKDMVVQQCVGQLTEGTSFELPGGLLKRETQATVDQMVSRGQQQGATEEQITEQQDQIFENAAIQAQNNLKANFMLNEIAKKEELTVDDQEIIGVIAQAAEKEGKPIKKFIKELQEKGEIPKIREQLLIRKVLTFLADSAEVTETDAPKEEVAA